eukprot:GHVU01198996.1.p2 GENE.GHVU01198996.1~~GHVU01198996.1.p2  ORF type:complete len:105 (-),score=21.73 GHVU01198996.1:1269-1583(-)
MTRDYFKHNARKKEAKMQSAVQVIRTVPGATLRVVARKKKVPYSTLQYRSNHGNTILSAEEEWELVFIALNQISRYCGINRSAFRALAYNYAKVKTKAPHSWKD